MDWSTSTGRTWCTPPGSRSFQKKLIYYRYGLFGVIGGLTKGGVLLKRGYSSRGEIKSCHKSRRMRLEVTHQRTAHSTSQRTDSYAKSKHAGSRVVVEAAISIGGSK